MGYDLDKQQYLSLDTRLTVALKLVSGIKVAGYCFLDLASYLNSPSSPGKVECIALERCPDKQA